MRQFTTADATRNGCADTVHLPTSASTLDVPALRDYQKNAVAMPNAMSATAPSITSRSSRSRQAKEETW